MKRSSLTRLVAVLGTAVATVAATTAATPADASRKEQLSSTVVASGLDNPRHLAFDSSGHLFVAEAGVGGSGPCMAGPEGGQVCFGTSGAVSKVWKGGSHRVLTGLPSLAAPDGSAALGPSDLVVGRHGRVTLSVGLGANPAVRTTLPSVGKRLMGTLTSARFLHSKRHVVADLAAFEAAQDPDKAGPDSDPTGFLKSRRGYVATDAGGNTLLKVSRHGKVRTLAVFPSRLVPPPFPGDDIDMQAVPTSVVKGSDGAYYVSQLTGFPFPQGGASIFRVVPGHAPTVFATGLTNVTDLAWHHGKLYAVQISNVGLASEPEDALPTGSLVRVHRGSTNPTTVATGLPAPYGVAIRGGSAYVTTCTVCPDGGGVTRISLK